MEQGECVLGCGRHSLYILMSWQLGVYVYKNVNRCVWDNDRLRCGLIEALQSAYIGVQNVSVWEKDLGLEDT